VEYAKWVISQAPELQLLDFNPGKRTLNQDVPARLMSARGAGLLLQKYIMSNTIH